MHFLTFCAFCVYFGLNASLRNHNGLLHDLNDTAFIDDSAIHYESILCAAQLN